MATDLATRRKSIGGSDAAAAVGLDPYRSQVQLWLEKTGRVKPPDTGEAAYWGQRLEEILRSELHAREGIATSSGAFYRHPEHEFICGHLDGLTMEAPQGVVEYKTAGLRAARHWEDGEIPLRYQLQGFHYLACSGLSHVIFACLIGGQRFVVRRLERDERVIEDLIAAELDFWRHVEEDEPPAPDGSESAETMIGLLYPQAREGKVWTMSEEELMLVDRLEKLRAVEDSASRQCETVRQEIKMLMGDAAVGVAGGRVAVRWPEITARRVNLARLKEEYPQVAEALTEESTYRRFTCP